MKKGPGRVECVAVLPTFRIKIFTYQVTDYITRLMTRSKRV